MFRTQTTALTVTLAIALTWLAIPARCAAAHDAIPIAHKTAKVAGLEIFYREVARRTPTRCSCSTASPRARKCSETSSPRSPTDTT